MNRRTFSEPIFRSNILFLSDCEDGVARQIAGEWFLKNGAEPIDDLDEDMTDAAGFTLQAADRHFAIWARKSSDIPTIAHEAVHVGVSVMSDAGHDVHAGDEPLAYYVDWLVKEMT